MSTVKRQVTVNPIEPSPLSLRAVSGIETRIDFTFFSMSGALLHVDVLPQLELTGRTRGGPAMTYSAPATDVVNGKARAVIPAGDLTDRNGYVARLYGTWNSEPILLATGVVAVSAGEGAAATPADVIDSIDITLTRGDDTALNVVLWVDTGKTQPYDLSTVIIGAAVYASHGGSLLVPFTIASTSGNAVMLHLTAAQITPLPDSCWWSLTVSDAAGVTTLCEGTVTVL